MLLPTWLEMIGVACRQNFAATADFRGWIQKRVSESLRFSIFILGCFTTQTLAAEPPITALAFAPDGSSLVAVSQAGLEEFDWPGLKRKRLLEVSAINLHCVVFSPVGKTLAVGGGNPSEDGVVQVFAWPSGKTLFESNKHVDSVRAIAWMNPTQLVSAGMDRGIQLWKRDDSFSATSVLRGHSRSVEAVLMLDDGLTLISAGADQSVRVWNTQTNKLIRSMNQHTKSVHDLALRPRHEGLPMVASAADDRTIRFWQPTIGRMVRYVRLEVEPLSVDWKPDGAQLLAACVDGCLRIIDPDRVEVTHAIPAIDGWAYAVAAHPSDGSAAVGGSDGQLKRISFDQLVNQVE